jgi:hypothetical protein
VRVVVIVAHPDDEAIGAGGLLAGLPDAVVAHVTDGAPRDVRYAQSKGFQTREEYARARRREVVNALAHVGITPDRCRDFGYVDGEASMQLLELVFDVADLMDEVRPDIVLTHPRCLFTSAPHEGKLDYERFCTIITGAQWRLNARKALDTLRTRHHRFVQAPELGNSAQIKIE